MFHNLLSHKTFVAVAVAFVAVYVWNLLFTIKDQVQQSKLTSHEKFFGRQHSSIISYRLIHHLYITYITVNTSHHITDTAKDSSQQHVLV